MKLTDEIMDILAGQLEPAVANDIRRKLDSKIRNWSTIVLGMEGRNINRDHVMGYNESKGEIASKMRDSI